MRWLHESKKKHLARRAGRRKIGWPLNRASEPGVVRPLCVASQLGDYLAALVLVLAGCHVDQRDDIQRQPLLVAVQAGHRLVVRLLVRFGGASFEQLARDHHGMSALHFAAEAGHHKVVWELATAWKPKIDELTYREDWTALKFAIKGGHIKCVENLLRAGASPDIIDRDCKTALHIAVEYNQVAALNYCITIPEVNPNLDAIEAKNNDTPLHLAARLGYAKCARVLLANGARFDLQNIHGRYPADLVPPKAVKGGRSKKAKRTWRALSFDLLPGRFPRETLVRCADLSRGAEHFPIPCINTMDSTPLPDDFKYVTKVHECRKVFVETTKEKCECGPEERHRPCVQNACACASRRQQLLDYLPWYSAEGGVGLSYEYLAQYTRDPDILPAAIYECNMTCSCDARRCGNRVVQRGSTARVEVFRTRTRGWGVRARETIRRGQFVAKYTGELLPFLQCHLRTSDHYYFGVDPTEEPEIVPDLPQGETVEEHIGVIDSSRMGNFSRFFNHMCDYNMIPLRVFTDHHDTRYPDIAFFASREIDAGEELGFDYGPEFWRVRCMDNYCKCDSRNCLYSKEAFSDTAAFLEWMPPASEQTGPQENAQKVETRGVAAIQ